jgi:hypothetical protein
MFARCRVPGDNHFGITVKSRTRKLMEPFSWHLIPALAAEGVLLVGYTMSVFGGSVVRTLHKGHNVWGQKMTSHTRSWRLLAPRASPTSPSLLTCVREDLGGPSIAMSWEQKRTQGKEARRWCLSSTWYSARASFPQRGRRT